MERTILSGEPKSGNNSVSAIIVAAGRGTRMGGLNKQFMKIAGVPVLARAVSAFEQSVYVSEIVVVTTEPCIKNVWELASKYGFKKISQVVTGGSTRQLSAQKGLDAVHGGCDFIAVHDGARPFVRPGEINSVIEAAFEYGASAAAAKVKDTIKVADENGFIVSTPDRDTLWAVQTPQIFDAGLYRRALDAALASGRDYTDDCQLVESVGVKVRLVECGYSNIKITTREDLAVGERILKSREDDTMPFGSKLFSDCE